MKAQQPVLTALLCALVGRVAADSGFSLDSTDDIKKTAGTITKDLLAYYHGDEPGQIPGILPGPPGSHAGGYYWFQGANLWSTLIDYWHYTGDSSHNDLIAQGLLAQRGENNNYLPANFSASIGNDDQADWALAALLAAERGFPNPPSDKPKWVDMSVNVFNDMVARWDTKTCQGGLRWQIFTTNKGYDVKLCSANTRFFDLSARLARYTGNKTYIDWADKTWDWMESVKLLDNSTYAIFEGAQVEDNCKKPIKSEISADNAHFALGAAFLYNQTNGDQKWKDRVSKLLDHGTKTFFDDGVAIEPSCEAKHHCGQATLSYKGELVQAYTLITQVAPFANDKIQPLLKNTAAAAAKRCSDGEDGKQCGFEWADKTYDKDSFTQVAVQQMNAAIAVDALLVDSSKPPATDEKKGNDGNGGNGGNGGSSGNGGSGDKGGGDDGKGGKGDDNKSLASGLVSASVMAAIISPLLSILLA